MSKDRLKTTAPFAAVVFLVIIDRLLKAWAVGFRPEINLLGSWFHLVLAKNQGVAFSLPLSGRWLIIIITLIIIGFIYLFILNFNKAAYLRAALYLSIILGASSNLFDRLKFGFVIDYFDLSFYSVFNLADAMIVVGLLGILWFGSDGIDKKE